MTEEPEEDESTEARFRRVQEELRAMELPEMPDEEVEARLADIQGRGRPSLPDVPLVEDGLKDLESRTAKARGVHRSTKIAEQSRIEQDGRASKGLGVGLAIAYALIGLPLVGLGLGFLLHQALGGPWIPIGVVAGFVGGIVFALFLSGRESGRL